MRKHEAKRIIREEKLTWGDIKVMLRRVRDTPWSDWKKRSVVNPMFTKGFMFNIYWEGLNDYPDDELVNPSSIAHVGVNVLRDFDDRDMALVRTKLPAPKHEEPMEIGETQ